MYAIFLLIGFLAITLLGLLIRRQIRPVLCRLLACAIAIAGFVVFPLLEDQITAIPPPLQLSFQEADDNASGPANLLQVFAVDGKGFITAQEIPLREAQILSIPLDVYGSVELMVSPDNRNASIHQKKTRLPTYCRKFIYFRFELTPEENNEMETARKNGVPWIDIHQPLQEKFFDTWQNLEFIPHCQSKNSSFRLSWRLIRTSSTETRFDLAASLAKYDPLGMSRKQEAEHHAAIVTTPDYPKKRNLNSMLAQYEPMQNRHNMLEKAGPDLASNSNSMIVYHDKSHELPCALFMILSSSQHVHLLFLSAFALFITLPLRLPLALPLATLISLFIFITFDNQNWQHAKFDESDQIKSWRLKQHSLFFSQGEAEVTRLEKILLKPDTKIMQQVKP